MTTTGIYLNFTNETEKAFEFYRSVFGGEFVGDVNRFGDAPPMAGAPALSEADKKLILHVGLPILGGIMLMGSDAPASMGFQVKQGNNTYISLHPDSRAEADRLFKELSSGGKVDMPLTDMFWGAYYGTFTDQFGIQWMINTEAK